MKARLFADMGPGQPRLGLELVEDEITIGRDPSCSICLEAGGISRVHARLVKTARGYMVLDQKSANGVFVNGERVSHCLLSNGDVVRLGTTDFSYTEDDSLEKTVLEAGATARIPVPEEKLVVRLRVGSSPVAGLREQEFEVSKDEVTIGRDSRNDIAVPDKKVSRLHARLVREEGRIFLVDNQSGNGTFLRGDRIEKADIYEGDAILIGETVFEVVKGPQPAPGQRQLRVTAPLRLGRNEGASPAAAPAPVALPLAKDIDATPPAPKPAPRPLPVPASPPRPEKPAAAPAAAPPPPAPPAPPPAPKPARPHAVPEEKNDSPPPPPLPASPRADVMPPPAAVVPPRPQPPPPFERAPEKVPRQDEAQRRDEAGQSGPAGQSSPAGESGPGSGLLVLATIALLVAIGATLALIPLSEPFSRAAGVYGAPANAGAPAAAGATSPVSTGEMAALSASVLVAVGSLWVFLACVFTVLAAKTGTRDRWMAWVPIFNALLLCRVARRPGWWVILLFIPIVNIAVALLLWLAVAQRRGKPSWLGGLTIVPVAGFFAMIAIASGRPGDSRACPACGSDPEPGDRFCGGCGKGLD